MSQKSQKSLKSFIESVPELAEAQELVFFGGSFNPWHRGHLACIKLLPQEKKLVIVPDHNPYKDLVAKSEGLVDAIEANLKQENVKAWIFDGFLMANKKNPTWRWINQLHESFPEKKLALLMGFDSFAGLADWIEASRLLNALNGVYVVSRQDDPILKERSISRVKELSEKLNLFFLGGHPHERISSTNLRKEDSK